MIFVSHSTGRNHSYHVARNDIARFRRGILELFADCDLFTQLYKAGYIVIRRMIGHAAHGRTLVQPAVAPRKRDPKKF